MVHKMMLMASWLEQLHSGQCDGEEKLRKARFVWALLDGGRGCWTPALPCTVQDPRRLLRLQQQKIRVTIRMGWPSCSRAVGRLLRGLLSGCRCCGRQLQQLLQLLLHMKPAKLIRHSGRSWSWLWGTDRAPQYHLRVLLVGKRFTGKTTLLYRLKLGAFIPTKPSVGSNTGPQEISEGPLCLGAAAFKARSSLRQAGLAFIVVQFSSSAQSRKRAVFAPDRVCMIICHLTGMRVCFGAAVLLLHRELFVLHLGHHHTDGADAREEPLDVESAPARPSTSSVRVAVCDVAGGDGESLEWQGLQRDLHNARSTGEIKGLLELPEEVKETALSGSGLVQVQQWLASVAVGLSRSNSFWRSACPRNFRRGGARAITAKGGSDSNERQQELLGTCATEASSFIQPLAERQLKADGGDEALRQALQTTVLL
ncbi:hypothetical protein ACSSS7_007560 [Eimeria intestinalis]